MRLISYEIPVRFPSERKTVPAITSVEKAALDRVKSKEVRSAALRFPVQHRLHCNRSRGQAVADNKSLAGKTVPKFAGRDFGHNVGQFGGDRGLLLASAYRVLGSRQARNCGILAERCSQRRFYRGKFGGPSRNRTGVYGFAVRCVTTPPSGHPGQSLWEQGPYQPNWSGATGFAFAGQLGRLGGGCRGAGQAVATSSIGWSRSRSRATSWLTFGERWRRVG